jgi:glycosyltransferase involved in cell wall biosynthesis
VTGVVRIGINALYLIPGEVGGTEIMLRELVKALDALGSPHEFVVFTNRETGRLGTHCVELPVEARSRPARILYEQLRLPGVLRRERIDALLNAGFTAPLLSALPQVTIFLDLQHKRHPEYFRWFDLPFWRFFLWGSARKSKRLVAISEATGSDLAKYYNIPSARIDVAQLGVEPGFFDLAPRREDGGYILYPSTTHPHKNHDRLLRVFRRLLEDRPGMRLVLTGVRGFVGSRVEELIIELGLEPSVDVLGWLPREELYDVYRRATAFIYPSRFEGFGMPVLEALAAGLPSACSNIEPLRSISGGAALLFDPDDDEQILAALLSITGPERDVLAKLGPPRAREFTWRRTAEIVVRSIEDSLRA